jgi:hypothetical protein
LAPGREAELAGDEVSRAGEDSDNAGDDLVTINVLIGYFTPDSHRE